jgi:hypothetical protein
MESDRKAVTNYDKYKVASFDKKMKGQEFSDDCKELKSLVNKMNSNKKKLNKQLRDMKEAETLPLLDDE